MFYLFYIIIVFLLMPMIPIRSSVDKLYYLILSLALPIVGIYVFWIVFRR